MGVAHFSEWRGNQWWGCQTQPGNLIRYMWMSHSTLNLNRQNVNIDIPGTAEQRTPKAAVYAATHAQFHSSLTSNLPATHNLPCLAEHRHRERPSMGLIWPLNLVSSSRFPINRSKHLPPVLPCAREKQFCRKCLWRSTTAIVMETSKLLSGFAAFSRGVCGPRSFIAEIRAGSNERYQKSSEEQPI